VPNFQELKDKIGDWLAVDTARLPDTVRGDLINLAMRDLSREHDLWLNEKTGVNNIGWEIGLRDYPVPSDFSRPHSIWYLSAGKVVFLTQKSKEQFDILFPDSTQTGSPVSYTLWSGSLQFGPTPDAAINANLNYYTIPADLTGAISNFFTTLAWEALFFRALVYASKYLIEDPRLPVWEQAARDAELKLVIEHARARHSGGALVIEEPG
jgi:hypothetical protein